MIDIASGHTAIDRYLAGDYERVRGMSSRFAAAICGFLLRRQSALGIAGDFLEIGTFEGRFFIAMALGLTAGEKALGVDTFEWPNAGVEQRFLDNCAAHLPYGRYLAWKADSRTLTPPGLRAKLAGARLRFVHIDSEHKRDHLAKELALVHPLLHEGGVICLDDMLHPGYPLMVTTVFDYLARHPELRLMGIIDREDIVASPKFLICHRDWLARYQDELLGEFQRFHYTLAADMEGYLALVLTPEPRLAAVE